MSNLDYSIALLSNEKSKLDLWVPTNEEQKQKRKANLQDGLSRAMDILLEKKREDEMANKMSKDVLGKAEKKGIIKKV